VPWFGLWPIVTLVWLLAVPFVFTYVAVGFIMEAVFGIRVSLHRRALT